MTEFLSPQETQSFRAAQKKRAGVVAAIVCLWIVGIFALTLVKGQMAVEKRMAQPAAATESHDAQ